MKSDEKQSKISTTFYSDFLLCIQRSIKNKKKQTKFKTVNNGTQRILADFILSIDVFLLSPLPATTTNSCPLSAPHSTLPLSLPFRDYIQPLQANSSPSPLAPSRPLNDLERVYAGHYERRPVAVKVKDGVEVEAYFTHKRQGNPDL